jgi:hypothetical protein
LNLSELTAGTAIPGRPMTEPEAVRRYPPVFVSLKSLKVTVPVESVVPVRVPWRTAGTPLLSTAASEMMTFGTGVDVPKAVACTTTGGVIV